MRLLSLSCLLLFSLALTAQIAPPDFTCTRSEAGGDLLSWTNRSSNCGPFLATEIYRADAEAGPYVRIAEIADTGVAEYRDENPNGLRRFYYLTYRYDCPGQTALSSDTLDNFVPVTPVLEYLSVEDGNIVLNWQPSASPEVSGYIIFEVTPTDFLPIDTVGEVTSYTVGGVPADEIADRRYRIAAIDPCGNDSPQGDILSPAGLTGSGGDGCTAEVALAVDRATLATYAGVTGLELFVATDGGNFLGQGVVDAATDPLNYGGGSDGESLCFYVEAVLAGGARARSVPFCQMLAIVQPARPFRVFGVEVTETGDYRFTYEPPTGPAANLTVDLERVSPGGEIFATPLPGETFATGELVAPAPDYVTGDRLRFELTDACDRDVTTNSVAPVELTVAAAGGGGNLLRWSPLVNGLAGEVTYDLERSDATGQFLPLVSGLTDPSYTDGAPPADGNEVCYRVRAKFRPTEPAAQPEYVFVSAPACVTPIPGVFLPNVFSPRAQRAENRIFRPEFTLPPVLADYELTIFDRWGGVLFTATDPATGWDGTSRGRALGSGTYFYVLRFVPADGVARQEAGTVNLLR